MTVPALGSSVLALVPKPPPLPDELGAVERLWLSIGMGGRIAVVAVGVLVVGFVLYKVVRGLGRRGRRALLWGLTTLSLATFVALATWVLRLPETRGSVFILWHQLVRVGAALSATGFVLGAMALGLPKMLDVLEGRAFVAFVSTRHVRADKSGFLTVVSVLSIVAVALSAFALCAVISIMGGFGADLKRKILGNNAHIRIDVPSYGGFDDWEPILQKVRLVNGVEAATPVVGGEAMASSTSNTAGVLVRGIDPDSIGSVIELIDNVEVGQFRWLTDPAKLVDLPPDTPIGISATGELYLEGPRRDPWLSALDDEVKKAVAVEEVYPGIIVGRELAKTLHVYVGDEIDLVSPLGDLGPMGIMPRNRKFRVAAIFYSGMYEYDSSHAYMLMEEAQGFLDLGSRVTTIDVRVQNSERVGPVTAAVTKTVEGRGLRVRDWQQLNKNLFSALKLEKIMTFVILSLAIMIASFCIICTLLLMVTEKSKEIAILKAMGASDGAILRVFVSEGVIIGSIGTFFGVVTGLAACLGLKHLGVRLDPNVYYVDRLPIAVDPFEYFMVAVCAVLITTLATIYPALAASRLRPVDGIRYE